MRQNLRYFLARPYEHYLILSGDQLYPMDYRDLLQEHVRSGAEITLSTTAVNREAALSFGIMQSNAKRRIFRFEEKPKDPKLLEELRIPAAAELYQGSMGIYVFNRQTLIDALDNSYDFGKHIIPASLKKYKVFAYIFQGYWEDIGTVRAFFEAHLALTDAVPAYNFSAPLNPIYTRPQILPSSKINRTQVHSAIIADGCNFTDANIERAVIGLRSVIATGSTIRNSVLMGADFYQDEGLQPKPDLPPLGTGRHCVIEEAIVDKNVRIGDGVVVTPEGKHRNVDGDNYYIRDGLW